MFVASKTVRVRLTVVQEDSRSNLFSLKLILFILPVVQRWGFRDLASSLSKYKSRKQCDVPISASNMGLIYLIMEKIPLWLTNLTDHDVSHYNACNEIVSLCKRKKKTKSRRKFVFRHKHKHQLISYSCCLCGELIACPV